MGKADTFQQTAQKSLAVLCRGTTLQQYNYTSFQDRSHVRTTESDNFLYGPPETQCFTSNELAKLSPQNNVEVDFEVSENNNATDVRSGDFALETFQLHHGKQGSSVPEGCDAHYH